MHDQPEMTQSTSVDVGSADDDCSALVQRTKDNLSRSFTDYGNVLEHLQAMNEALRRELNAALGREDKLKEQLDSQRDEFEKTKMEQQQQTVNEWQLRKAAEEELIKLKAKQSRDTHPRDRHGQYRHAESSDIAANLHVTGSRLATETNRDLEREGHGVVESRAQRSPGLHVNSSLARGHVTTLLPEALPRIRRDSFNSTAMLADTYPPRPGHQLATRPGHEVMDQSSLAVTTLPLPPIPHRKSST